ncbi:MAG TPA: CAP domain-containing protein, partial [Epsilonproteobacteria bacterium]|nr:CAP domain-containing protein [Campylobacterota bacterium]
MRQIILCVSLFFGSSLLYGGFFNDEKKVVVRTQPAMDIAYEKSEAFSLVNQVREALGMNTLMANGQLAKAAQAHAEYLVKNRSSAHTEVEGLPGFTGV